MPALLYLHGFLSSPQSHKAQVTGEWLKDHRPDIDYHCPFLTPYPDETSHRLQLIVEQVLHREQQSLYLMGSSLGGFWATWLSERYNLRAALINPLVEISLFRGEYIGKPLKNYHTSDTYTLSEVDAEGFAGFKVDSVARPENYLVMLQTGDEVLDYRLAVEKYSGSILRVEQGGDHAFQHYEHHLGEIISFFEQH